MAKRKKKATSKKWIQQAINPANKGALHRSLGVPEGEKIPSGAIAEAAKKGGRLGKMARLAKTLGRIKKKGRRKS